MRPANAETCRDLIGDREWLKSLAFPKPEKPAEDEEEPEALEQAYTVEVSGKRFDVKVIGPPLSGAVVNGSSSRSPKAHRWPRGTRSS